MSVNHCYQLRMQTGISYIKELYLYKLKDKRGLLQYLYLYMPVSKGLAKVAKKQEFSMENMTSSMLYDHLSKQSGIFAEQEFSTFITKCLKLPEDSLLQFYILTHCIELKKMGEISRDDFDRLFKYSKVTHLKNLQKHVAKLQKELQTEKTFKEMYTLLYSMFLIKDTTLDYEYAEFLWKAVFKNKMALSKQFCAYLDSYEEGKKPKKVHKDLWGMVYQFLSTVKNIHKDYSEADAWPIFLEDFADYVKEKK